MNPILLEFAGRMADQGATQLPETYRQMAVNARFFLGTRMAAGALAHRLDAVTGFRLNLEKGRLVLSFEDAPELSVEAQIIGTWSDDGSWMWGWGHPEVPEPMQQAAWAVQHFGERQEIEELLTRGGPTQEERARDYMAICAYISDADGVFMGDHGGGGQVCVCYYQNDQLKGLLSE